MNKEIITENLINYQSIGEQISNELATQMVKEHRNKFGLDGSYSFFIGREIIEQTLAQPGCVGVRLYDAINELGEKTFVTVGIDSNGKNILEIPGVNKHGKIVTTEGMLWDKILNVPDSLPSSNDNPFTVD